MKLAETTAIEVDRTHIEIAVAAAVAETVAENDDETLAKIFEDVTEEQATEALEKVAQVSGIAEVSPTRAARLWASAVGGASVKDLEWAHDAAKSGLGNISVTTRYGGLSRGKCWGRRADGEWADKSGSVVYLTEGKWKVGSSDGFNRKESPVSWNVRRIGAYLYGQ